MRMQKAAAAAVAEGRQATTRMGTRSKGAANGNNGNSSKMHEMEVTAAASAYDSDSFENHVIDLRGDEEYQSMREGDESEEEEEAGDSGDFEEHFSMNKEEGVQSHSDTTFGNTVSATEGANTDSEMEATKGEQHGDPELSNGVVATNPSVSNGGEGTATEGDEGSSLPAEDALPRFMPGQLVWAKFARFPWWPAQVTDERTVQEGTGGHQRDDTDVLVHFFGTYDFGWVDPNVGLAEFDAKLQERSKIHKKALQKGIEEALEFRNSGKLPEFFAVEPREPEPQMPNNSHCNGIQAHASQSTPEDEETGRRLSRKRKPKVLYEEEERVQRKPERRLRRLRIMRQLGLVAPAGSPFTLDTRMSV
ncbi:unnamed protein product [Sphagnum jensenii]|uniref:PWWP domain-containing protein n=1 Tax=Sphagnum jensenii TaxID=128206 RepID=A0ABP0XBS6_9BRYO